MQIIEENVFDGCWDILMHCANTKCTFGAGVAAQIKKLYPAAYDADLKTAYMGEDKLSLYSYADIRNQRIYNLYAQVGVGNDGSPLNRNLQYDYLYDSMFRALHHLKETCPREKGFKFDVAIPYLIGCGLAGGSEKIVLAILEDLEKKFDHFEFLLYKLPTNETILHSN